MIEFFSRPLVWAICTVVAALIVYSQNSGPTAGAAPEACA